MIDTNANAPESLETLRLQQQYLLEGKRFVQMFPVGTPELGLPANMQRVENERGVFHYNPAAIDGGTVLLLSAQHRENLLLMLGPYSKHDISDWLDKGARFTVISEYTPDGVEVRTAAASDATLPEQRAYFERTKQAGNDIYVGALPQRVQNKLKALGFA